MPSGRFIILRSKKFNDSDLLVDVLSREGERLSLTAKNGAKSKRRFAGGVLEPINFSEIQYTAAKSSFLYIQEAKLIDGFTGLRQDYQRLELAFHLLKLVAKAAQEGLPDNKALFDLLGNTLRVLESSSDLHLLKLQFELKYLYYLGFLAPDQDTAEFVALPIKDHTKIQLTDEEHNHLSHLTKKQLNSIEL